MKMIKASHWKVRGELELDKRFVLQGRRYRLVSTRPYQNARGKFGERLVWSGTSVQCRRRFTFETTRSKFYPTATCAKHRPSSSRRRP